MIGGICLNSGECQQNSLLKGGEDPRIIKHSK